MLASPVAVHNYDSTQEGYTLVAPTKSNDVYLVNNKGKVVHSWETDYYSGLEAKLLDDGRLLRSYTTSNASFDMGGQGGGIQIINWDGSVDWDYQLSTGQKLMHHDVMMMPNGNVLAIAWEKVSKDEALAAGVNPENIDDEFGNTWSDTIIEINPDTNRIVWQWRAFDHLVQNHDADKPNYGKPNKQPRKIDANYYQYVQKPDWLHVNSVSYNQASDQIMISPREFNELWVIDHSTTTEQAATSKGGKYGHGGDLLYRHGNPEAYGQGSVDDRQFFLQHDIQWLADDLPGAGNVLLFNNGDANGNQEYSNVLELKLPQRDDGNYRIKNNRFVPAELVWQYTPAGQNEFFSQFMGGAQRLPNGNTIVADAMAGRIIEVTTDGGIVWSYKNDFGDKVPSHADENKLEKSTTVFRAYKYAPNDPAVAELKKP